MPDEGAHVAQSLEFFGREADGGRARNLVLRRRDHTVRMVVDDLSQIVDCLKWIITLIMK